MNERVCNNSGTPCVPNKAIKCTVDQCAYHCRNDHYCGLESIQVGTHEASPTKDQCTDCQRFRLK